MKIISLFGKDSGQCWIPIEKYEVVNLYSNCEDALENLDRDHPDIVLMDIELPGMDGIAGTIRIKKQYQDCIVLIITVLEDSEKVFRSLCAGAGGYIVKNSNISEIVQNIDEALAGGAPMSLSIARMVVQSFRQQQNSPLTERETEVLTKYCGREKLFQNSPGSVCEQRNDPESHKKYLPET